MTSTLALVANLKSSPRPQSAFSKKMPVSLSAAPIVATETDPSLRSVTLIEAVAANLLSMSATIGSSENEMIGACFFWSKNWANLCSSSSLLLAVRCVMSGLIVFPFAISFRLWKANSYSDRKLRTDCTTILSLGLKYALPSRKFLPTKLARPINFTSVGGLPTVFHSIAWCLV